MIIIIFRKGQQRLHFLRELRSCNVDKTIMTLFYRSVIQSVLTFSIICWCGNRSVSDKNKLQNLVNICSRITGQQQPSLANVFERRVLKKAKQMLKDDTHFHMSFYHQRNVLEIHFVRGSGILLSRHLFAF